VAADPASDPQAAAIAYLSDPSSHGLGTEAVERLDTHGAMVFLAGDRAYKLKRAVKFPYMDFSTVERRRRFCEAEVALNRRTAPGLYLGAEPIMRRADGRLGIGGVGEPVDWVVIMRRFDQSALLDDRARRGTLDVPLVLELADEVYRFHCAAKPAPDFGGRAGLRAVADGNAESLRVARDILPASEVEPLIDATVRALARVGDLADRRRAEGKIRRCHGDLHLRNICLIDGRPTLFDCIEFDDAIACIDVMYDLAFLLMDLWHRGLKRHANAVLNRYLDLSGGDGGVLAALPLFLSLRAAVRAHVGAAALVRQPAGTPEAVSRVMGEEARRYLAEARGFLEPPPPVLVAIGGLSGTGKSTLAYLLAPETGPAPGARVIRSDVIRKRLMGVAWHQRLPESAYADEVTERVYAALLAEAADALGAGHGVIADAVFARPWQRDAVAAEAAKSGNPFHGLWLEAPPEVLERRIGARRADASDATVAILRRQLDYEIGPMDWTRIDVSGDEPAALADARRVLGPAITDTRNGPRPSTGSG
jgi:aminoglycoside phosphotransferase family enzyme